MVQPFGFASKAYHQRSTDQEKNVSHAKLACSMVRNGQYVRGEAVTTLACLSKSCSGCIGDAFLTKEHLALPSYDLFIWLK